MSMPLTDRLLVPIVRRISDFVVKLTPQSMLESSTKQLEQSGSRRLSAAEFWLIRIVLGVVMAVLFFFVLRNQESFLMRLLYTFGIGLLGFMMPQLFLRSIIDRRKQAIMRKLPDALDLMTICVDAGLTFDGAMSRVHEKWDDPLANDFGRVIHEMQLGKSRRQALRDMEERMGVADVTSFVASVLQADQLGVSFGRVLKIQSEQMRLRRRQRAEEKAQQASIKMLFPLHFHDFPLDVYCAPRTRCAAGCAQQRSARFRGVTGTGRWRSRAAATAGSAGSGRETWRTARMGLQRPGPAGSGDN